MKKEAMELWWIDLLKSLCFIILVLTLIHLNDAKLRCLITLKNGREQELK